MEMEEEQEIIQEIARSSQKDMNPLSSKTIKLRYSIRMIISFLLFGIEMH